MPKESGHNLFISRREFIFRVTTGIALSTAGALDTLARVNSLERVKEAEILGLSKSAKEIILEEKGSIALDIAAVALGAGRAGKAIALKTAEDRTKNILRRFMAGELRCPKNYPGAET